MFEKYFNRPYEMYGFPHFVPQEELEYNIDYAKKMVEEKWIYYRWREDMERQGWKRNAETGERIASHGGLIVEICAGPGAGFVPATLMNDYNANIMISDLCPTVVREWYNLFKQMDNPPPNIEYAAFNVCDMPFNDDCIDVGSGSAAIINIEGNRDKALKEIYRIIKPGGLFAFDYIYVTEEFYKKMNPETRDIIKDRFPTAFWDSLSAFEELEYSSVQTKDTGTWSNEEDGSSLADLCRILESPLTFSSFTRYCIK